MYHSTSLSLHLNCSLCRWGTLFCKYSHCVCGISVLFAIIQTSFTVSETSVAVIHTVLYSYPNLRGDRASVVWLGALESWLRDGEENVPSCPHACYYAEIWQEALSLKRALVIKCTKSYAKQDWKSVREHIYVWADVPQCGSSGTFLAASDWGSASYARCSVLMSRWAEGWHQKLLFIGIYFGVTLPRSCVDWLEKLKIHMFKIRVLVQSIDFWGRPFNGIHTTRLVRNRIFVTIDGDVYVISDRAFRNVPCPRMCSGSANPRSSVRFYRQCIFERFHTFFVQITGRAKNCLNRVLVLQTADNCLGSPRTCVKNGSRETSHLAHEAARYCNQVCSAFDFAT